MVAAVALLAASGAAIADDRLDAFAAGMNRAHADPHPVVDYRDTQSATAPAQEPGAIKADAGYELHPKSKPPCEFEVPVSTTRTHENYRKYPVSETDVAVPGERIRVHGILQMSQKGGFIGVVSFPGRMPWMGKQKLTVLLDDLTAEQKDYLRDHCEPDFPCAAHFLMTYLGMIKTPEDRKRMMPPFNPKESVADVMNRDQCTPVKATSGYVWNGSNGELATLDKWED